MQPGGLDCKRRHETQSDAEKSTGVDPATLGVYNSSVPRLLRVAVTSSQEGRKMAIIEASPELGRSIADVVAMTQEMFDCAPVFEVMRDPEDPDCSFVVLTVEFRGDPSELLTKRLDWHSRIKALSRGDNANLRLSIIPLPCNPANS
jgi:hypothetical protein